jgi:hypothetical protein
MLMQRIEVLRDGGILEGVFRDVAELEQPAAEPICCAAQAASFTRSGVDSAVRQSVQMPRCRDSWISPE